MKVKSESEVTQSYPTPSDPMDCSAPGSSVHGVFQARVPEWGAIAFSNTGILHTYFCHPCCHCYCLCPPEHPDFCFWNNNCFLFWGFPGGSDSKESACNVGDWGSIPGSGRSPGEGNGNLLQYSCLENSMDREKSGGLQSMGLQRIEYNWAINTFTFTFCGFPAPLCADLLCLLSMCLALFQPRGK